MLLAEKERICVACLRVWNTKEYEVAVQDSTKWVGLCHSASQAVKDVEVLVYNLFGAAACVIYPQTTPKLPPVGCQLEQAEIQP